MKQVRSIVIIFFVLGSVIGAVLPIIIVFIQQSLSSVTKHFGSLIMILGIGLFPGSLVYGRLGHRAKQSLMLCASLILSGAFFVVFTLSLKYYPNFILAAFIFFILGFVLAPIVIIGNTAIHKVSDNGMMGKVFSSLDIFSHLLNKMMHYYIEIRYFGKAKHKFKNLINEVDNKFRLKKGHKVPHITLIQPFTTKNHKWLISDFKKICSKHKCQLLLALPEL